ncbi:MAG TPA: hypothetical protein VMV68_01130 [Spirochaetia bacterium]|nr:hypothetical protein [Spirochaetia bacterium]
MVKEHAKGIALEAVILGVSVLALFLTGCSTFGTALSFAMGQNSSSSQPQPSQPQPQPSGQPAQPATSSQAYQMNFNAFYSGFWNFGWFGYGDPNYKAGQGTVWEISGSGSSKPVTFERALLAVNADGSQWWRLKFDSGKDSIIYEFLVGKDTQVQKVRFKDPESGQIGEFVPTQNGGQPSNAPAYSREQLQQAFVGKDTVKVPAGTFTADHYIYTDQQRNYKYELWTDSSVPGYMIKFEGTQQGNRKAASSGRLIQIETGATTELGSF